ncbi:unnamed protein product [Phytophthora fragariaefolia]|uniref:Unnamed protein product n=1 Tax=Phytophthora fragariaefolia TaxID=1490495 RepID=A0A9W6YLJ4_9STRA|nr:unnamed protein product [Phytophthora fragariaefolia]
MIRFLLRKGGRTPASAPAQLVRPAAPGDTQLAAAHEVVRLSNAADTEAAAAQAQSASVSTAQAASPPAAAIGDAPSVAGPFQPAAPVQAASTTAQDIAVLPAQAPPFTPSTCARGRRPARRSSRRSLEMSASPATTPIGRCPAASTELIATSPHIEDKDDDDAASIDHREGSSDAADGMFGAVTDDEAEEEEVTARGNELLADNDDDLNAVDNSSNSNFGAIESGDEAEKDDVEIGEYDSSGDTEHEGALDDIGDDQEETETEIAAEVLFAEKFLDTFGGEDEVLAGSLNNAALRSMAASGWEAVEAPDIHEHLMAPYEPVNNAGSYPGLRQGYSGPTAEALRHGDSPVALFFFMMPVVLWQHIAACSNEYHRENATHCSARCASKSITSPWCCA